MSTYDDTDTGSLTPIGDALTSNPAFQPVRDEIAEVVAERARLGLPWQTEHPLPLPVRRVLDQEEKEAVQERMRRIGEVMAGVDRAQAELDAEHDPVNHPSHYTQGPKCECGRTIECIDITRHRSFNMGNALKYIWRADLKGGIEDIRKAVWYLADEIDRREAAGEL